MYGVCTTSGYMVDGTVHRYRVYYMVYSAVGAVGICIPIYVHVYLYLLYYCM